MTISAGWGGGPSLSTSWAYPAQNWLYARKCVYTHLPGPSQFYADTVRGRPSLSTPRVHLVVTSPRDRAAALRIDDVGKSVDF